MIPTRDDSEFIHAVYFGLSALIGGGLGLACVPAIGSGNMEADMRQFMLALICGTTLGGLAWLAFKYKVLKPDPPYKR